MAVTLTEEQKAELLRWISEGATLGDIQKRLGEQFSVSLTYMDTRFLLDDLNLALKEPPKKATAAASDLTQGPATTSGSGPLPGKPGEPIPFPGADQPGPASKVRVVVDKIVRPGAVVSGSVTFSDAQTAEWYLDQSGRLGLIPKVKGYQPKPADVQDFQYVLQDELAKMGY